MQAQTHASPKRDVADAAAFCLERAKGFELLTCKIAAPILIRQLPLMTAANAAKACYNPLISLSGAPGEIRTPDPQVRSLPARPHYELWGIALTRKQSCQRELQGVTTA